MSDEQTPTVPPLGGEELAISDAKPSANPILIKADQTLIDLMHQCPSAWQGDHGFQNWVQMVYDHGVASVPPPDLPPE